MGKYDDICAMQLPWEKLAGKSVLVTGANGLIASSLVDAISEASKEHGLGTQIYAMCRNAEKGKARFAAYEGDPDFHLMVQDVIEPVVSDVKFDYIVHAASSAFPGAFNDTPVDVMKANFIGTMNLLDLSKDNPGMRFMYVSSSEVYGENEEGREIFTEDSPSVLNHMRFRACYPESKRASETLSLCYEKQYGSDVVIVRPAFIYGRDVIADNTRADVYFLKQALAGEDIVMYSPGEQIRSYCYMNDCVSGMLFALLKGESGQIYNIGNEDCVVTMREYAQECANAGGVKLVTDFEAKPEGTVFLKTTKLILDTTKLRALGWKPAYSLADGFAHIFEGSYPNGE